MRIALNALTISPEKAGVGNFAYHVIRELQALAAPHDFDVYVNASVRELFSDTAKMRFVTAGDFPDGKSRLFYELTGLRKRLDGGGYQLVHFLDYVTPLMRMKTPFAVTVHDVGFFADHSYFTPAAGAFKRFLLPISCRRAKRVVTVSEFTARELTRFVGTAPEKISAIPLGADPMQALSGDLPECVLCVGTIEPRKNWLTALRAMERLWERDPQFTLPLVFAGKEGWKCRPFLEAVAQSPFRDRIRMTGYCSTEELRRWYGAAKVFLFPSFYEGFGLPPLEAMSCGVPVVASNAASLPEVLGRAAILCAPTDVAAFADGILRAIGEADRLRAEGLLRAKEFSWSKTAQGLLRVYESCGR